MLILSQEAWSAGDAGRLDDLVGAAVSTLISVVIAALAAYALTRLKFLGAGLLTTAILITYLLPGTLIFISHDREFVSSLATRIIEIKADHTVVDFQGNYEDYLLSQGVN